MLERQTNSVGVVVYASPLLLALGVPHAFSTRLGGMSAAPFDSLNLGNPGGCAVQDDDERIQENYRRFQAAAGLDGRTRCWVHQVHGGGVLRAMAGEPFQNGLHADAIVSDDPSRVLAVRVADCVPVLLATANGRRVAAIHAGWRGAVAGVATAALNDLTSDGTPIVEVSAAIGACIGFSAFEVGAEVIDAFRQRLGNLAPVQSRSDGKGWVDLREAIRLQLIEAGLPASQIDTTDCCTVRDQDEFFSHRRDNGVTGRMAAIIGAVNERRKGEG